VNEILSCTGSKYTIASTLCNYNDAINKFKLKRLAFVGMPCQIQAVRKLQLSSPLSKEYGKFSLIIGLFCYSNYSYDLMETFIQGELGVSLKNIKKIDVSHGKFYIYIKDGSIKEVPIKEIKKYTWESCHYCKDYTAEIADISVGSVGALKNDWNSVILRTDIGAKFFNEAVKAKKIVTSDEIEVFKIEKESLRKKTQITQIDSKILDALRFLSIPDDELKTYTTLMSLGNASESIISKVMKMEEDIIKIILDKLEERKWITATDGIYSSNNPTLVINNEINQVKDEFLEKINKLKTEVLPNLETVFAQNNHVRQDEAYD